MNIDEKNEYIRLLLKSRLAIIDPFIMTDDEINTILESCWPLYEHLNQKENIDA